MDTAQNGESSIKTRETESVSSVPCVICRRQFSRYTCPRCNIPYCSLVCFRSEKHADCSESFYRKEVELDVKSAPSASTEEKRRVLDLLKRFEEDTLEESPLLHDSDNEDEEDDLERRLQDLDLESASYDELWHVLTPAEREKFLRALDDPESELAKQLLASEELEKEQIVPWWEASPENPSLTPSATRKHGAPPSIMDIPESLTGRLSNATMDGPLLLYNICAVCIAYTYTIRHFAVSSLCSVSPTDPDHVEIRQSISRLVPFVGDRKSTLVHTSLSGVVTDLWSRFPSGHMNPQFFSLLLKDTAAILRPATVTVLASATASDYADHPSANLLRLLSDVSSLFSSSSADGNPSQKTKTNSAVLKLTFYAAYVLGTSPPLLRALADEASIRARTLEDEGKAVGTSGGAVGRSVLSGWSAHSRKEANGWTLELNEKHAKVSQANIDHAELTSKIKIVLGPTADSKQLPSERPFDLAFIDADKENNIACFIEAERLVRKGGIIPLEHIKTDTKVEATTITAIGEAVYDGFLLALRV